MKRHNSSLWLTIEQVVPWLVLAILLIYSYAKFFRHSYGFRPEITTGLVMTVFEHQPEPTLKENDRIIQIGSVLLEDYRSDLSMPFLDGYKPGDVIPIKIERDGQTLNVSWKYPAFSRAEFFDQLYSEWWIAYVFWVTGVLTILLVRPKDDSWLLMSLFSFLTAIWVIAGSGLSAYHIWYSAVVLRMTLWLCVPVYLHLHWVFPRPLGKLPPLLLWIVYGVAICLAVAQGLRLLPNGLYSLVFLIAVGGSLILLLIHVWRQPSIRRDFRLLLIVLMLAVAPGLVWAIVGQIIVIPPWYAGVGLLSLPLLPLAYLYISFRRRLGNLEMRLNRFFTIYLFVILLGVIFLPFVTLFDQAIEFPGKALVISTVSALLTALAFIWGYPPFEKLVDHRILGIPLPSKHLLETYSTRITTSLSLPGLVRVLCEEVFPSLLIRQFAFLQYEDGALSVLSMSELSEELMPREQDLPDLLTHSSIYRSPELLTADQPYPWIRLTLPLKLGDRLIGFWLLGRRDPDDFYSQQEIPILSSLANLTAIALSNILQTEHLKFMYETNISRYEAEKLRLAHDLHDSILNEMAALLMRVDSPNLSPKFLQAFDELTEKLREIVDDLRPPMLAFGLRLALADLAEDLMERNQDSVQILTDIQADDEWRYPEAVENNLYRIVQQACENSLHHAHAKKLLIFGRLHEKQVDLRVEDNGVGLDPKISFKLNDLLVNKHFGLVGMFERASLIKAEMSIHSQPNQGTRIQVLWKSSETI
ncbi:MAG: ATP-binding protein [Anaerolineales bacterium]